MLIPIKDYENLYSLDTSNNEVYNHKYNRYKKTEINYDNYIRIKLSNKGEKRFQLHRLIYQAHNPDEDISEFVIDHIDGNKQNNNINNLRKATVSQNGGNRKIGCNNTTGYKNIIFTKYNTFRVWIKKDGEVYSKSFKTLDEAITNRNEQLEILFGEFKRTE